MARIEGVNWNDEAVRQYPTEKAWLKQHMDDEGTYTGMDKVKKENTLKLVYRLAATGSKVEDVKKDLNTNPPLDEE